MENDTIQSGTHHQKQGTQNGETKLTGFNIVNNVRPTGRMTVMMKTVFPEVWKREQIEAEAAAEDGNKRQGSEGSNG